MITLLHQRVRQLLTVQSSVVAKFDLSSIVKWDIQILKLALLYLYCIRLENILIVACGVVNMYRLKLWSCSARAAGQSKVFCLLLPPPTAWTPGNWPRCSVPRDMTTPSHYHGDGIGQLKVFHLSRFLSPFHTRTVRVVL